MGELTALKNIIRAGWVSSVDIAERTARVTFKDKGDTFVSGPLKVLKNPPWVPEYYAPYRKAAGAATRPFKATSTT